MIPFKRKLADAQTRGQRKAQKRNTRHGNKWMMPFAFFSMRRDKSTPHLCSGKSLF